MKELHPIFLFFVCLFLTSCSNNEPAGKVEREMAEAFFSELLFQERGCFTLLGDKPITSMLIFTADPQDSSFANLSQESLQSLNFEEYKTAENYEMFKKLSRNIKYKNYSFVEIQCSNDPSCIDLLFINIAKTKEVFEKNKGLFAKITGVQIDFNEALKDLNSPQSTFWSHVFQDHYLSGLLYGYGEENIRNFCEMPNERVFSESFDECATQENFPIPVFAVSQEDVTTNKYKEQREKIKKIFENKVLFEVAVEALQK